MEPCASRQIVGGGNRWSCHWAPHKHRVEREIRHKDTKGKDVPGHIHAVVDPIVPAVEAVEHTPPDQLVDAAVKENVRQQAAHLRSSQPVLAPLVESGKLKVVGAEYELVDGKVDLVQ